MAVVCLPLRAFSSDAPVFVVLLIAASGCALAAGAVLRNMDGERRLALAVATQEERDGLARDLHDDFTNRVTSMILMVQATRRSLDGSPSGLDDDLARVEAAGSEALVAMRRWVSTLRASGVEQNPELGGTALSELPPLLEHWESTSTGGRARLIERIPTDVPDEVQTAVHRIVQEAVTNVSRHAPRATWLEVSVTESGGVLDVRVVSPLEAEPGSDPVPGSAGLGLLGMRERTRILGGSFEAGPDGATWAIRAAIPLDVGR
ncbi:sensor histidine kinase [Rathayibacter tanaceti]|uniref:histidine kinase n=1 Tax=Rathayibacter tanaceti TaxID=1671680 RepID=A0A162FYI9_9MICO|nr:histidine kinase [Rathayibacter tanaceti]KZX21450.1 Sensor histidine kinase DesK [Rathayibacter tanaceti]